MFPGPPPQVIGGDSGVFSRDLDDTDNQFAQAVNYYRATSTIYVQSFYVELLASMMQGNGSNPHERERDGVLSKYTVEVDTEGTNAYSARCVKALKDFSAMSYENEVKWNN